MIFKPLILSGPMMAAYLEKKPHKRIYPLKGEDPNGANHLLKRLLNGALLNNSNSCWEWQRATNSYGYGTLTVNHKPVLAHRLMWRVIHGSIQPGMLVCHHCDNPACINPDHLFTGTQTDNMNDCSRKGRINNPIIRLQGEENPSSKLTWRQVGKIIKELAQGQTQAIIAQRYGVSQSSISNIAIRKTWHRPLKGDELKKALEVLNA